MTSILKPTAEEHAYHEGWTAFFNQKDNGIVTKNQYNEEDERSLFESWANGFRSAETMARAMTR